METHEPGSALELITQLRTTLGKMELVLASVAEGIAWIDGAGRVEWCNAWFDRLVDQPHIEILGRPLIELLPLRSGKHPVPADRHPARLALIPAHTEVGEYGFGLDRTLRIRTSNVEPAGTGLTGVLVLRDVTAEHLMLRERERRIREKARRVEAEKAVRLRDDFMQIASHELRTPLTVLAMHGKLLVKVIDEIRSAGVPERIGSELDEALALMDRQIGKLSKLVSGVLDVSRLTSGRLRLETEEFDLAELVTDVVRRYRDEFSRVGTRIDLDAPVPVRGRWDAVRLEQVVVNLLVNAMKFGRGRPIAVSVGTTGDTAWMRVTDHGIGIARKDQGRVFEAFRKLPAPGRPEGMGLGLFISRQIVEAHRGTIRVESELDAGTTFIVELPRKIPTPCGSPDLQHTIGHDQADRR